MVSIGSQLLRRGKLTAAGVFLGLEVLAFALGLAAAAFFGAALVAGAAFDAGTFLVAVFFGAALAVCGKSVSQCSQDETTRITNSLLGGSSLGFCGSLWRSLGGSWRGCFGSGALLGKLDWTRGALGTVKDTSLASLLELLVENGVELSVADSPDLVVGEDILLESLAAAISALAMCERHGSCKLPEATSRMVLTKNRFVP